MIELIERLEKAKGWDRELDFAIGRACPVTGWRIEHDGSVSAFDGEGWYTMPTEVPAYTHSIDAALTLVPDGWQWMVSNRAPAPRTGRAYVHNRELINIGGGMTPNPEYRGSETTAATPAIALCITALEIRMSAQVGIDWKLSEDTKQQLAEIDKHTRNF